MTKQTMKEGLSLFGFDLHIEKEYVTFKHQDVEVTVYRRVSEDEVKLLLMNIPRWYSLANDTVE